MPSAFTPVSGALRGLFLPPAQANGSPAGGHDVEGADAFVLMLLALGLCSLGLWIARRIANPRKLLLKDAPGRPHQMHPLHVLGVLLGWVVLSGVAFAFRGEVSPEELYARQPWRYALMILSQAGAAGLCLLVAAATFRGGLRRGMGFTLRRWRSDTFRGVLAYLAVFPICWALAVLMAWIGEVFDMGPQQHSLLRAMQDAQLAWWAKATVVVSAVVMAPVTEELLFRGVVQSFFRRYMPSPWLAVLAASGLFTVFHAAYPLHWPALFALSIALGYNYERTGRLLPAMVIHGLFNGVQVAFALSGAA